MISSPLLLLEDIDSPGQLRFVPKFEGDKLDEGQYTSRGCNRRNYLCLLLLEFVFIPILTIMAYLNDAPGYEEALQKVQIFLHFIFLGVKLNLSFKTVPAESSD